MKKKNLSFWMLGIAAVLASCSSEDLLQEAGGNNGTATFTVALDGGMKTRAADDGENDGLSLAAYVIDNEGGIVQTPEGIQGGTTEEGGIIYTFTVSGLPTESTYRIVCWAYNAEEYTADQAGGTLTAADGNPGIAYYGDTGAEALRIADMDKNIPMTHAVGKVTLVTTKSLEAGRKAELSVPTYRAFNLLDGTLVTGDDAATMMATATSEEGVQVGEDSEEATLCSVYVLCGSEVTDGVTVTTLDNDKVKTIDNVPVKPNVHVTLKGDANLGIGGNVEFTAEIATEWEEGTTGDLKYGFEAHVIEGTNTIKTFMEGQIAENPDLIESAIGTGNQLTIEGPMNEADLTAIKNYLKGLSDTVIDLNLSDAGLTAIPAGTFYGVYTAGYYDERIKSLGKVSLPTTLTEIENKAFRDCPSFTIANWDELTSLTTIKNCAFMCSGLDGDITLPENIKTIEQMAFYQTNITSIVFPSSITTIGIQMFFRSYNLKKVVFKGDITSVEGMVFGGCSALEEIDFSACTTMPTPNDPFNGISTANINKIKLIVNKDLVSDFEADPVWSQCQIVAATE